MILTLLAAVFLVSLGSYVLPVLAQIFYFKPQNLRRKYGAEWALVTGASSGIGRSIAEKCAAQGVNVVLVALDDDLLRGSTADLKKAHPDLCFRSVGTDFSPRNGGDYMTPILASTSDINVSLVFNNAGYIKTGLFANMGLDAQMANIETNALAAVRITHHFAVKMRANATRGLIAFTSSSAAYIPCPMSAIYGATKAFITEFAASIAPELYPHGIDVCVVHPSPVNSRFYANAGKLSSLYFFQKTAVSPATLADCFFAAAGRFVIYDQGYFSQGTQLALKCFDWSAIAELCRYTVKGMADFKALSAAAAAAPSS